VAEILVREHKLPVVAACRVARLSRTAWYRRPSERVDRDRDVIDALVALIEHPHRTRWGFWKCYDRLRNTGSSWNHKRVHRVYRALRLNQRRRTKKRVPTRLRQPLEAPVMLNEMWALDFMHDALYGGRAIRILNVIDEANREALAIEVGTSLPASRVVRVLEQLIEMHGAPAAIRCDNGPEFTSGTFSSWCEERKIAVRYIQPGKPDQNAYIERLNRTFRDDVLDAWVFQSVAEVQDLSDEWLADYNENRPHDSLGGIPPAQFLPRSKAPELSTIEVCA
jgi:putative transposase